MCSNTAASNLEIDASVAGAAREIAVQNIRTKVRKLTPVGDNLMLMQLQTPRSQRLRFLAGQYACLSVAGIASYDSAIASCPCDDMRLEFHIRRVADEPFSKYVFDCLKPGTFIEVEAPRGEFVLREDSKRPIILIAFDTGFAAIKSVLEHATAQDEERRAHLYWITCGADGHYLDNLCRSWADALDQFRYTPLSIKQDYDRLLTAREQGLQLVDEQLQRIVADYPDMSGHDVYMVAPDPLLAAGKNLLTEHGLPHARLMQEPVRGNRNVGCVIGGTAPASGG